MLDFPIARIGSQEIPVELIASRPGAIAALKAARDIHLKQLLQALLNTRSGEACRFHESPLTRVAAACFVVCVVHQGRTDPFGAIRQNGNTKCEVSRGLVTFAWRDVMGLM